MRKRKRNWFSNFYPFEEPLVYQGMSFPTVEHFFQAMKCRKGDLAGRQKIANARRPSIAKKLGKNVHLRHNWEEIKLDVMEYALRYKFAKGTRWRQKLMKTHGTIVELNNWHDNYWGRCECRVCRAKVAKGDLVPQNHLGKLLMKLREEISRESPYRFLTKSS